MHSAFMHVSCLVYGLRFRLDVCVYVCGIHMIIWHCDVFEHSYY